MLVLLSGRHFKVYFIRNLTSITRKKCRRKLLGDQTTRAFIIQISPLISDNDVSEREEGDGRRIQEGAETLGKALPEGEHIVL